MHEKLPEANGVHANVVLRGLPFYRAPKEENIMYEASGAQISRFALVRLEEFHGLRLLKEAFLGFLQQKQAMKHSKNVRGSGAPD